MTTWETLGSRLAQLGQLILELPQIGEEFVRRVSSVIQETSAFIATLRGQHEDVRLSYTLQTARHNLRIAVQKANRFLDQVHEISFHCSAESELMRAAKAGVAAEIYTFDLHPLRDLVDQLTQNIAMA